MSFNILTRCTAYSLWCSVYCRDVLCVYRQLWHVDMLHRMQFMFRRPRPVYNKDDMHIVVSVDKFSFPSGESSLMIINTRYSL
jgi:hypothetical protein